MKAHLRPNEEPHDLAYWMVLAMNFSVWLTLMMLPFLAVAGVSVGLIKALPGSVSLDTAAGYLYLALGVVIAPFFAYGCFRVWLRRKAGQLKGEINEHLREHATHGGHLVIQITREDAKAQWPEIERRLNAWEKQLEYGENDTRG